MNIIKIMGLIFIISLIPLTSCAKQDLTTELIKDAIAELLKEENENVLKIKDLVIVNQRFIDKKTIILKAKYTITNKEDLFSKVGEFQNEVSKHKIKFYVLTMDKGTERTCEIEAIGTNKHGKWNFKLSDKTSNHFEKIEVESAIETIAEIPLVIRGDEKIILTPEFKEEIVMLAKHHRITGEKKISELLKKINQYDDSDITRKIRTLKENYAVIKLGEEKRGKEVYENYILKINKQKDEIRIICDLENHSLAQKEACYKKEFERIDNRHWVDIHQDILVRKVNEVLAPLQKKIDHYEELLKHNQLKKHQLLTDLEDVDHRMRQWDNLEILINKIDLKS